MIAWIKEWIRAVLEAFTPRYVILGAPGGLGSEGKLIPLEPGQFYLLLCDISRVPAATCDIIVREARSRDIDLLAILVEGTDAIRLAHVEDWEPLLAAVQQLQEGKARHP
jgi:hypothetical protein